MSENAWSGGEDPNFNEQYSDSQCFQSQHLKNMPRPEHRENVMRSRNPNFLPWTKELFVPDSILGNEFYKSIMVQLLLWKKDVEMGLNPEVKKLDYFHRMWNEERFVFFFLFSLI